MHVCGNEAISNMASKLDTEKIASWIEMIKGSWTWEKLTDKERKRFLDRVEWMKIDRQCGLLRGVSSERQIDILNECYHMFLLGLDYNPFKWRTTPEEASELRADLKKIIDIAAKHILDKMN